MRLTTLGTSCAQQTATRCQSAHALSLHAGCTYLFDCGSATARQLIHAGIRQSTIYKVFITHLHADHVCGLPGLLCDILGGHGGVTDERRTPIRKRVVDVYGPKGIAELLRTSWRLTYVALAGNVRIHELLSENDVEDDGVPYVNELPTVARRIDGGVWRDISTDDGCSVLAVPIEHTVPCLGYVLKEDHHVTLSKQVIDRLSDAYGRGTKDFAQAIKTLKGGSGIVELGIAELERRPGRQAVLLGDTCDASSVLPHVNNPHLLLHESTNAHLQQGETAESVRVKHGETAESVRARAISRGHSTPEMAGELAHRMGAKLLVLTHFSSRYAGDVANRPQMRRIEAMARQHAPNTRVIAAWDGMQCEVQ